VIPFLSLNGTNSCEEIGDFEMEKKILECPIVECEEHPIEDCPIVECEDCRLIVEYEYNLETIEFEYFNVTHKKLGDDCSSCKLVKIKDYPIKQCVHPKGDHVSDYIIKRKKTFCEFSYRGYIRYIQNKIPEERNQIVAMDVGANIGSCSLWLATKKVKVYAFEPISENLKCFYHSIALNKFEKYIRVLPHAAGDNEGYSTIFLEAGNYGNNLVIDKDSLLEAQKSKDNNQKMGVKNFKEEIAHIVKIDDHVKEHVHFAKFDTQGHEYHAIQGALQQITKYGIDVIYTEYWPRGIEIRGTDPVDFLLMMHDLGYYIYRGRLKIGSIGIPMNDFDYTREENENKFLVFTKAVRKKKFTDLLLIHNSFRDL
jgi:FkbM family methyltransferase